MKQAVSTLILAMALCTPATADGTPVLVWRQVGVLSGAAIADKTASYAGQVGGPLVGPSSRDQQGLFEAASSGAMVVATEPWGLAWPVTTAPVDSASGAVFDLPIRWVYETDNLVTGQPFAEMGQTFVAAGSQLSSIACFVATQDEFDVTVRKDGPKGEQVGPGAGLKIADGQSMGVVKWRPGQVQLEAGKTYYVGIKSKSDKPFSMYLHSTGDIYPSGCAFFSGVYFKAASGNIRAAYAVLKGKGLPARFDVAFRCSRLNTDATLTRVGPEKTCPASVSGDGFSAAAVFGPQELPVVPGQTYYLEVVPVGEGIPTEAAQAPRLDLLVDIYGEKTPGMMPAIYNQRITSTATTSVGVGWNATAGARTRINYGLTPHDLRFVIDVPKGQQSADIKPIRPGTTFCFKITAETGSGGRFETPVYQHRTLDAQGQPVTDPPMPSAPPDFLPLAPAGYLAEQPAPPAKGLLPVTVPNSDFENGLLGWTVSPDMSASISAKAYEGKTSVGWDFASLSDTGKANSESAIYRAVDVTPGRTYILSAGLLTDQAAPATDLWARLICDPSGGTDFSGANSTQWFRTGGKWMRFWKSFRAESRQMTIGVGFRKGTGQFTAALADSITLSEVREPSLINRIMGR